MGPPPLPLDPGRRQRGSVVVAAYNDHAELEAALTTYVGTSVKRSPVTRLTLPCRSVVLWHAGHQTAQARGRTLRRAIMRGVEDPRPYALDGPLPSSVAYFGWDSEGNQWSPHSGPLLDQPTLSDAVTGP